MDDPKLLRDLARTAREEEAEEQQRWERWERLNDGAIAAEEEAELNALAATSVEAKQAFEAFRPLDSDFRARMVATIGPLIAGKPVPEEVGAPNEAPVWVKRPQVVREKKRARGFLFPWWRAGLIGSGFSTAAAALFLLLRLPPLPLFSIAEVESGVVITRSGEQDPEERPVLVAGAAFTAKARPAAKVSSRATIEPRCYILSTRPAEREIRPVDCAPKIEPDERGSMILLGTLPEDLTTGRAILWIVLSYRGDQPDPDEIEKLPTDRPTLRRNWDAGPTEIEIRAS